MSLPGRFCSKSRRANDHSVIATRSVLREFPIACDRAADRGVIRREAPAIEPKHETRAKAFDIPILSRRGGFVEIFEVENEVASRGREAPEIQQMTVATGLDLAR